MEIFNHRIRLIVWIVLLVHITGVIIFSETKLPLLHYLFCYVVWFGHLYFLLKRENEVLKGLSFLIANLATAFAFMQKGESYYLRLTTISLLSISIYSIQGYPPYLIFVLGMGYFWLHKNYQVCLAAFYEPITSTYRIPAFSLEQTLRVYQIGLFLEILCLVTYQVVLQRIWKRYQKAEQNIEETNQKLQDLNIQLLRNEELTKLNRQLQNALHSQDLFVACVSHELRNPLNVLLGSLDLLEPQLKEETNQLQLLKTCRLCGDALLSQMNNLLDVAKINADKLEITELSTNMAEFLDKFWSFSRIGLQKKGLLGYLAVGDELPLWLNIDATRLQQILNNLVGNSTKFTAEGSIRVTFRCIKRQDLASWKLNFTSAVSDKITNENPQRTRVNLNLETSSSGPLDMIEGNIQRAYSSQCLQMKTASDKFYNFKLNQPVKETLENALSSSNNSEYNYLKISVIDTGCGIPEEAQKHIFEPFVQGDRSITRKYGGTGLGLYIIKTLVAKMGGDIKVSSHKDIGTYFEIVLPAKPVKIDDSRILKKH